MEFSALSLAEPLLKALREENYATATPIQAKAIPVVLTGRDLFGCAQTGTGKTAAFALPILHRMLAEREKAIASGAPRPHRRPIKCLVLAPTRELALQIGESFRAYGRHTGFTSTVIFGGVGQRPQEDALRRGIDIVVACPGRLLDLMGQGFVDLRSLSTFVLDEADRMLDMGFIHDIRKIVAVIPRARQTLFFSATMPREIRELASTLLSDPATVEVAPVSSTAETVEQSVFMVDRGFKQALLGKLLENGGLSKVLVFTRTKHGADKVVKNLEKIGVKSAAIHGNKSQNNRVRAIEGFRAGSLRVLVASDIAARGLDIDGITHVVNYELPNEPETYVHRIGRTGRAGERGIALSFCDGEERAFLRDIERIIRRSVPVATHEFAGKVAPPLPPDERERRPFGQGGFRGGRGGASDRRPGFRGHGQGNSGRPNHGRGHSHQSDRRSPGT